MRNHTLYLLLAGWGLLAASCYDDKSTLQTTHIPPVEIEVPEAIASQLTVAVLEDLKRQGLKVVPLCRFMARYILRHPEWKQMVADK